MSTGEIVAACVAYALIGAVLAFIYKARWYRANRWRAGTVYMGYYKDREDATICALGLLIGWPVMAAGWLVWKVFAWLDSLARASEGGESGG